MNKRKKKRRKKIDICKNDSLPRQVLSASCPKPPFSSPCPLPQYPRHIIVPVEFRQTKPIMTTPTILHRRVGASSRANTERHPRRPYPWPHTQPASPNDWAAARSCLSYLHPAAPPPQAENFSIAVLSRPCRLRRRRPHSLLPRAVSFDRCGRSWRGAA